MRATEITPLPGGKKLNNPDPDRLTKVLIWVVFFLIAGLAAVAADLWLRPATDGPVAQASELTASPTVASAIPTPLSPPAGPPIGPPTHQPARPAAVQPTQPPTFVPTLPPATRASPTPVTPSPCIPPDDWGIHTVQPGNTLESLARRYGTDLDTLMRVNCLNTQTIFIEQRLYVPGGGDSAGAVAPPTAPPPNPGEAPTPVSELVAGAELPPTMTPLSPFRLNMPSHYLNILLMGSDKRPNSGAWRTDSMIIVSVDSQANVVRLLSLPRDLWVYIPGHGNNRINTADLWGELAQKGTGPERVKQTIYHNLGIPIHYYVRVDFQGFMKIIDTVGGVDIDVACPLPDIDLSPGMHHMNGKQALRFARSRKSTSTFDRERRQRKVLMALWDQSLTLDLIPQLPELWRTMADAFQTDLPLEQVINLAYVGAQLEPQRIRSSAIGAKYTQSWITPQGAAVQLPREEAIRTLLENFYAPIDLANLDEAGKVRVRVLNGSARTDAERLAAATLKWEGFKVVGSGQADRQDYAQTSVLVYNGDPAAGEQAARALRIPPGAVQVLTGVEQPDPANPVDIQILLGGNYNPCQR